MTHHKSYNINDKNGARNYIRLVHTMLVIFPHPLHEINVIKNQIQYNQRTFSRVLRLVSNTFAFFSSYKAIVIFARFSDHRNTWIFLKIPKALMFFFLKNTVVLRVSRNEEANDFFVTQREYT